MKIKSMSRDIMYKGEVVATVHLNRASINPTAVDIHLDVHKWSVEIYKELLMVFGVVQDAFRDGPIKTICTAVPVGDKKIVKFWEMMGFTTIEEREMMGHKMLYAELEV